MLTVKEIRKRIKAQTPLEKLIMLDKIKANQRKQWETKEEDFWKHVYIFICGEYHKIGIAINIKNRLKNIQCGNPYNVEFVYSKKVKHAEECEKYLHDYFKDKHHKLEWFLLEQKDIEDAINIIRNYAKKN